MRKLFVLFLCALMMVLGSVSAAAFASPDVVDTDTERTSDTDTSSTGGNGGNGGNGGTSSNGGNSTTTSPKTGVSTTYAVLMAAAGFVFSGAAVKAKKKLSE